MENVQFELCSDRVRAVLDNEQFGDRDFWEGYKLYCFAFYSKCSASKEEFHACKMGRVSCVLQEIDSVPWGSHFDEAIRQAWAEMEDYVQVRHNKDCKNLRALMEEFDDVEKLSSHPNELLLLQLIEDNDTATHFPISESLHRPGNSDFLKDIRERLNATGEGLEVLKRQSLDSGRSK